MMRDMRRMKVKEENRFLFVSKEEFLQDEKVGDRQWKNLCVYQKGVNEN